MKQITIIHLSLLILCLMAWPGFAQYECTFDWECDDGVRCTDDYCNEEGYCKNIPIICIPDGNICTDDSCDPLFGCEYVPNSNPCDDGIYCNGVDTCSGGTCSIHSGDPCSPLMCWEGLERCECFADHDCDGICNPGESGPSCSGSDDCPFDPENDIDADGVCGDIDNCPHIPNSDQLDSYPPQGNNCGDVCDCEGNFGTDGDVDGSDAYNFKRSFFRFDCDVTPCNGDFECDKDVDGTDAFMFKKDFFRYDCPTYCNPRGGANWCVY